jgi:LruC domain-containing protein
MNSKNFLIGLALLSLGVTACKEDYFDQDEYQSLVKKSFPVQNVDPHQTWSTLGTASVSLAISLNTNQTYSLKIYDQNPIGTPSTLKLLGQGSAADGQLFSTSISYALDQPFVYVALFDRDNYMSVYPMGIRDGKIEGQIGGQTTANSRSWLPKRAESHDTSFDDAPNASDFKTNVPAGALQPSEYWKSRTGDYVVGTGDTDLNFYEGNCNVYIPSGNYHFNSFAINNNTNIYLLPGASVEMSSIAWKYGNVHVYVAEEATLKGNINANVHFYNKGTMEASSIILYSSYSQWWADPNASDGSLYNQGRVLASGSYHIDDRCQTVNANELETGTLTVDEDAKFLNTSTLNVTGELGVKNDRSLFINEGTTTAASVGVEGSANFYNDGNITVSGTTTVNSNQCTWHNDGTYTTRDYVYQAGSTDVINNCRLIVTNRFYLGLGDTDQNRFRLNAGGSVVTKDFEFSGPGFFDMAAGSLLRVTGTAFMAITKDGYGIYGPTTGNYAVFQAREIVRRSDVSANQGFVANYFGRLYVATNSHFDFGYSDKNAAQQAAGEVGAQPYYRLDAASGAMMTTYEGANVHANDNTCGADYQGTPQTGEPQATTFALRYCFEDNFPQVGDYDFNDVVITLTPTIQGKRVTLQASLDAVGAQEQIGACIRIKDLKAADIVSSQRSGNLDKGFPTTATKIIPSNEYMLPDNLKYNGLTDVVLNLFSNAHWAIKPQLADNGSIRNWFYNTVKRGNEYAYYENDVAPAVVTFTFELASEAAAARFCEANLDVFIVEQYNGGFWEVHTIPFKTQDVLAAYGGNKSMYADNFPWAICVPGDFKYPVEWQAIGSSERIRRTAYEHTGHAFADWAEDHTQATDWYKYPSADLVYE